MDRAGRARRLHHFDLAKRQDEQLLDNVRELPHLGRRQEGALRVARRLVDHRRWRRRSIPADGRLAIADLEVRIDPRAEWAQIFDEAWRINRDYFYAPNMHGVDWPAMRKKYGALLPAMSRSAAT